MRCPAKGVGCDCLDCELHRMRLAMSWDTPRAFIKLSDVREDPDEQPEPMEHRPGSGGGVHGVLRLRVEEEEEG